MSPESKTDIFTYTTFDLHALCRHVSTLRQGVKFTCDPDQRPASGSFNWAIFILFEDDTRWVFRSPHSSSLKPMEMRGELLASEAATLRYLRAQSDIPVPEVYDYCVSSDNPIGVPFILMSEAPGRPFSKLWGQADFQYPLETNGKSKVLSQLGSITWKLLQLRFDKIGSVFEDDHTFIIKECLSRGHMMNDRCSLEIPRGPFSSKADFYDSLISALSEHAEVLPLSHHCFSAPIPSRNDYLCNVQYKQAVDLWNDFVALGCKIDSSNNRLDYILAADTLRGIVHQLDPTRTDSYSESETFPLCHPDLSINNVYVDEEYNITCIIDWEFASSVPEYMLLTTPGLPQYRDELSSELQASFIDGFIAAIPNSMKASLVRNYRSKLEQSHMPWKLSRLLSLDTIDDYSLLGGLWEATGEPEKDLAQYFLQQRRSSHYVRRYEEVREEDQPLSKIAKEENDHFRNDVLKKTVARKLTLISGWETQYDEKGTTRLGKDMFVTSAKLWKWIHEFMNDWEDMP